MPRATTFEDSYQTDVAPFINIAATEPLFPKMAFTSGWVCALDRVTTLVGDGVPLYEALGRAADEAAGFKTQLMNVLHKQ